MNKQNPKGVNLTGDAVHPGAPGQLMMAAALLKALGAQGFVSEATIDATAARADPVVSARSGHHHRG